MIEKLKAMEQSATPSPWKVIDYVHLTSDNAKWCLYSEGPEMCEDLDFIIAMRHIAPELIALWETAQAKADRTGSTYMFVSGNGDIMDALAALNAKAEEVL